MLQHAWLVLWMVDMVAFARGRDARWKIVLSMSHKYVVLAIGKVPIEVMMSYMQRVK
jgi:hypothetical protein